jgi:putative transposase
VNQLLLPGLPGHLAGGVAASPPRLSLAELDAALYRFIVEDYHTRIHSETRQGPGGRWEAGGFIPRMPERPEELDLLLLTVARPRKVHQDGIHFEGLRYMDLNLAAFVGESVIIRYDPRDLGEIRVFHEGRFLCRAVCAELASASITLKELQAARNRRRRDLRNQLVDRRSVVEQVLGDRQPEESRPAEHHPAPKLKRYRNE